MPKKDSGKIINIKDLAEKKIAPKNDKSQVNTSDKKVYQLKISLDEFKPPIYRAILVSEKTTLDHLHLIIQKAMGWQNYHLHDFTINGKRFTNYFDDYDFEDDALDEKGIKLSDFDLEESDTFKYLYDFGDCWYHTIEVEKILPYDSSEKYPICIKGARKCPPEDVGSISGFYEFLEVISDPEDEEYEHYIGWAGGNFNLEEFNLKKVNKALSKIKFK